MYRRSLLTVALVSTTLCTPAFADLTSRPDSHAPSGVMADHTHGAGEFMVGYRVMRSTYADLYYGSDKVSPEDVGMAGYSMLATDMTMTMHMLDLMYAPTDWMTLMVMPQVMSMDMVMEAAPMSGEGSGHEHEGHDSMMMGSHSHGVEGLGDTQIGALFSLNKTEHSNLIFGLLASAPTGDSDIKNSNGKFVHYGMQLGAGIWNLTPNLTYSAHSDQLGWGAQLNARLHLEDENSSGFRFGDRYAATTWVSWLVSDAVSLSTRLEYSQEDSISGHYNGPHNHSSPADIQANYGGEFLDLGIGMNVLISGVRIGLEWTQPIAETYNGYQLGREATLNGSLTYAF